MSAEVPGDPARDGASFVPSVVSHPVFRSAGVAHGRGTGSRWVVVDPRRHALYVWGRSAPTGRSYVRTALALDAVLFTNGPMMGRRLPGGRKLTRSRVPVDVALWTVAGATAGIAVAWRRTFTGWVPCRRVRGRAGGIEDCRDFDHEGVRHAWLGRSGREFASYRIGDGDLPAGIEEGTEVWSCW